MRTRLRRYAHRRQRPLLAIGMIMLFAGLGLGVAPRPASASIAKKLEPLMQTVAEQTGQRGLLVLTLPAADTQGENWGIPGVVYDESIRLLADAKVRVLVSPKVTALIEAGEIKGPVSATALRRIHGLATFDLLLTETYCRSRSTRSVDLTLYDGSSDKILWSAKAVLRDADVQPQSNVPEFNRKVVQYASSHFGQQVGDGECWTLAAYACKEAGSHRTGVTIFGRKLGALDSPLPGDVIQFEQARFRGKSGLRTVRHHTAVIENVQGPGAVGVLQQNVGRAGKTVSRATQHLDTKVDGVMDIFRPRPKVYKALEPRTAAEPLQGVAAAVDIPLPGGAKLSLRPIPAGTFAMGPSERWTVKLCQVTLTKPFCLGVTEVTQAQWKAVMAANPSEVQGDDLPVTNVSWNDAQKFLAALNKSPAGKQYTFRLPTEAEWEYACRAGANGRYPFGEDDLDLCEYGWYGDNSGGRSHPVGQLRPNRWGLYDMQGNVWELTQDYYEEYRADDPPKDQTDPTGPATGTMHVIRGGTFNSAPGVCSSGNRFHITPRGKSQWTGFRLAAVPK